jgi:glycosyltransferase involved in cell wall biosynthesis
MEQVKTTLPISIVIPTYCEEKVLPDLLQSINNQIFAPTEVIVADAQSPDSTFYGGNCS